MVFFSSTRDAGIKLMQTELTDDLAIALVEQSAEELSRSCVHLAVVPRFEQ
jgi:hypothetical protein